MLPVQRKHRDLKTAGNSYVHERLTTFNSPVSVFYLQSPPPPPHCHADEEEEEDLNKAFDVQDFQQILCPAARSPPEKHRVYDEQDIEGKTSRCLRVQKTSERPVWIFSMRL